MNISSIYEPYQSLIKILLVSFIFGLAVNFAKYIYDL